ncbi:MAG: AAA family ATPase [Gammaproteobacteria bacterium]|nr:AAA family ATPase [Gammaproteobacteria bacterium]
MRHLGHARPRTSGRKPLIIRGARQVGKSTLAQLFAEAERPDLGVVNVERLPTLTRAREQRPDPDLNRLDTLAEAPLA